MLLSIYMSRWRIKVFLSIHLYPATIIISRNFSKLIWIFFILYVLRHSVTYTTFSISQSFEEKAKRERWNWKNNFYTISWCTYMKYKTTSDKWQISFIFHLKFEIQNRIHGNSSFLVSYLNERYESQRNLSCFQQRDDIREHFVRIEKWFVLWLWLWQKMLKNGKGNWMRQRKPETYRIIDYSSFHCDPIENRDYITFCCCWLSFAQFTIRKKSLRKNIKLSCQW